MGALGRLPQDETAVALPPGQVAPLLVGFGAVRHLHEKRRAALCKKAEDALVDGAPQVVGVGEKRVSIPLFQKHLQHAATHQRWIDIAVTWRAPLQGRVLLPSDWGQSIRVDLWNLVLNEVRRHPLFLEAMGYDLWTAWKANDGTLWVGCNTEEGYPVISKYKDGVLEKESDPVVELIEEDHGFIHRIKGNGGRVWAVGVTHNTGPNCWASFLGFNHTRRLSSRKH